MVIDGYDILITSNMQNIINNYNKITNNTNKIIFSAEKGCWPDIKLETQYPSAPTAYKYLCAGAYIANIGIMKKLFNDNKYIFDLSIEELNKLDDQLFFTKIYLTNQSNIILDYNNNLFNSMFNGINDLEFKNNKWYNNITHTYPIIFHANGPHESKEFLFNNIYPTIINEYID
jgi:procollagen-lysine,2-oxoglutarate 5-dioxygenase